MSPVYLNYKPYPISENIHATIPSTIKRLKRKMIFGKIRTKMKLPAANGWGIKIIIKYYVYGLIGEKHKLGGCHGR